MKYPTTSQTLLGKIANGDEIGWNEFYLRYKPVVFALAKYRGLDDADAEDVLQQVMLAFFQRGKSFRFDPEIARFRTYFGKLVNARIIDCLRRKNELPLTEDGGGLELFAPPPDYEEHFLAEFRKAVLDDVLQQLKLRVSVTTWQAFELYAEQHRPVEKVAAFLHCSVNQVYQAKKRSFAIIREIVEDIKRRDPGLKMELFGDE